MNIEGVLARSDTATVPGSRAAFSAGAFFAPPGPMDTLRRHRWRVKDTICSPWQELPGLYTAFEIWGMRRRGYFSAATPMEESEPTVRHEELRAFYLFSES